jgi:hypothetical protein
VIWGGGRDSDSARSQSCCQFLSLLVTCVSPRPCHIPLCGGQKTESTSPTMSIFSKPLDSSPLARSTLHSCPTVNHAKPRAAGGRCQAGYVPQARVGQVQGPAKVGFANNKARSVGITLPVEADCHLRSIGPIDRPNGALERLLRYDMLHVWRTRALTMSDRRNRSLSPSASARKKRRKKWKRGGWLKARVE